MGTSSDETAAEASLLLEEPVAAPTREGEEAERLRRLVAVLGELAGAAADPLAVMRLTTARAQELTGAAAAIVAKPEGQEVVCRAATGNVTRAVGERMSLDTSLSGNTARSGQVMRCDDAELDLQVDRVTCRRLGVRSFVVAPMTFGGKLRGLLFVLSPRPNVFGAKDEQLLQVLGPAAGAALAHAEDAQLLGQYERGGLRKLVAALGEAGGERAGAALVEALRQPLGAVTLMATELLGRGRLTEADEESARLIARSAAQMEDLLKPLANRAGPRTDDPTG
jgi:GAF domain-containing protein